MANKGEFSSSFYGNECLKFMWEITSQSTSTNQTTIYWLLKGVKGDSGYYTSGNFRVNIDGNDVYSSATRIHLYNETIITDGTYTFTHDSSGNKTFTVYIEGGIYSVAVNVSGNATFELNRINRYPTFTTNPFVTSRTETIIQFNLGAVDIPSDLYYSLNNSTWTHITSQLTTISNLTANRNYTIYVQARNQADNSLTTTKTISTSTYNYPYIASVQSSSLVIGNSQKLTLYNPLSRTVTVKMRKDNSSGTELYSGTTSGTSITFSPNANTLYSSIPNSQSGNCVYTATYSGHTSISNVHSYKVIGTETPTFSDFTYRDSNSAISTLTGNNQVLVKGKSTLEVTISSANKMTTKNSATPKSYNITCDTRTATPTYSSDDIVSDLGTIVNSGTKRLTVAAYDSRNLSTSVYKDITIYDYSKPVINVQLTRLNNFENETTLKVNGTYTKLTINEVDKNALQQVQYRYRETDGEWSNYTTMVMTASNGSYSCTDVVLNLDNTKAFEFEIVATDLLDSNTANSTIDVGEAIFFIGSNTKKLYYNGEEMLETEVVEEW